MRKDNEKYIQKGASETQKVQGIVWHGIQRTNSN